MPDKIILEGFEKFIGKHCETTALKHVLVYYGLKISEEMLLGLGGGPGLFYWATKNMRTPFIGTRNGKGPDFLIKACRRVGADVSVFESSSSKKAYQELKTMLRCGMPAIVYGDMAYLTYFGMPETAHFGGHSFVVFGLNEVRDTANIYDRSIKPVSVALSDLEKARSSKYLPFPPKNRLLKIKASRQAQYLETGIRDAIRECCQHILKPPLKNMGLPGMKKWADMVASAHELYRDDNMLAMLVNSFIYIVVGGTGGSGFRSMYASFLKESSEITSKSATEEASRLMEESAALWRAIGMGFLPDSCPAMKQMRELMIERNTVFEQWGDEALRDMQVTTQKIDKLTPQAIKETGKAPDFLKDVRNNILKCIEIESRAFRILSSV
jgi:hypothetical protein